MLQESLLAILAALPSFRGDSSLIHFAIAIARRTMLAQRRTGRRRAEHLTRVARLELPLRPDSAGAQQASLPLSRSAELERLLGGLPEEQATALVLRALLELPLKRIAAETGVSVNTVRTRVRLARKCLRARIESDAVLSAVLSPRMSSPLSA